MPDKILERVEISGFKSIRNLELELKPLNIFIGANGSGKSNFIAAFKFLNAIVNENLQIFVAKAGGIDTFLYFGQKVTQQLSFYFKFGDKDFTNIYECTLVPTVKGTFIFKNEIVYFHNRQKYPQPTNRLINRGQAETQLTSVSKGIAKYIVLELKSWIIYHFHDTSDTARVKQLVEIDDNRFLRPDASNLAAYLYLLRETEKLYYDNIIDTIRLIAPFFDDFVLHPARLNLNKIKLEWREKGSDTYFDANALSDGTLRFMSLATLLLQPVENLPKTILLDEPELGLHPYAITVLANLLRSAAEHTQVIVSTQSVTLVNQFEPDDIIVVERRGEESIFKRLPQNEIDTWLDDYGLGDLWEKNVLGGRPTR